MTGILPAIAEQGYSEAVPAQYECFESEDRAHVPGWIPERASNLNQKKAFDRRLRYAWQRWI
jgi:hypothetical protein